MLKRVKGIIKATAKRKQPWGAALGLWDGNPINLNCDDHCTSINVINSLRKKKKKGKKMKKKKKKKKKKAAWAAIAVMRLKHDACSNQSLSSGGA